MAAALFVIGVADAAAADIPTFEREALVALYRATGGNFWKDTNGWMQDDQPELGKHGTECAWSGVTCSEDESHITEIDLDRNNLTGELPTEISGLKKLRRLSLAGNRIGGPLPRSLWALTELQELDLSSNQVSGEISERVGGLVNVKKVNLSWNKLTGSIPASFGDCLSLVTLSLGANRLTGGLPAGLSKAAHLEELSLARNELSGSLPSAWSSLTHLQVLDLSANHLGGPLPSEWAALFDLNTLALNDNRLSGMVPVWLFTLPELNVCQLQNNALGGEWRLPKTKSADSLKTLDLSWNRLVGSIPEGLTRLTRLRELDLSHNALTGKIPPSLFDISLDKLRAAHNRLTGRLPTVGEWPAVTDLSNNQLNGKIDPSVDASSLRWLSLAWNRLSGDVPTNLLSSDAYVVDLGHNDLRGELDSNWEVSDTTQILNLSHNKIRGAVPPGIFAGEQLLWLDISANQLRGEIPLVSHSKFLQVLLAGGNHLSGKIPVNAESTPWLAWLSLEGNVFSGGVSEVDRLRSLISFDGSGNPWRERPNPRLSTLPKTAPLDFVVVDPSTFDEPSSGVTNARVASERFASPGPPRVIAYPARFQIEPSVEVRVVGTVQDAAGGGLPGVTVTARGEGGKVVTTTTDASGSFQVTVPAGSVTLSAALPGFSTLTRSFVALPGQAQRVGLTLQAGGLTETVSVSADAARTPQGWWNGWVSEVDAEDEEPARLVPQRQYQYVLEVGSLSIRHAHGSTASISSRLAEHIARLIRDHQNVTTLIVRLFVIGRAIREVPEADREEWRGGRWAPVSRQPNTSFLNLDLRRMARSEYTPDLAGAAVHEGQRFGAIRLSIEAVENGCAAIAASIWDASATRPLDQFVHTISVGDSQCEDYRGQTANRDGDPFGFEPFEQGVGASLHLFEFVASAAPTSVAVLSLPRGADECPYFAWQLQGTLSGALFQPTFREQLGKARENPSNGYGPVARSLRDALFTGGATIEGCGPNEALEALKLRATSGDVDILVRAVDKSGRHIFPPFGLLSMSEGEEGNRLFLHRIRPIELLAQQSFTVGECVEDWRFVLPERLYQEERIALPDTLSKDADVIRSRGAFEDYLKEGGTSQARGIVLLAHHSDGYLTFADPSDHVGFQRLAQMGIGHGSISILGACEAGAVTDSSLLLEGLNRAGVDSFIMSPFEIDARFGVELSISISTRIVENGQTGKPLTVGELYRDALIPTDAQRSKYGLVWEGWASELVLAGNPNLAICRKPN
ncbi:MAG: carboxypeptidase regulatory-like domain-containing protein [Vicinamibacteria bacterium]